LIDLAAKLSAIGGTNYGEFRNGLVPPSAFSLPIITTESAVISTQKGHKTLGPIGLIDLIEKR
jgi:hypothetical protein